MLRKYYTRGDIILVIMLAILSVVSIASVRFLPGGGKHVVVKVDGSLVMELSLDRNVTTKVDGHLGETVIHVEDGAVRVQDSTCPHGYCVRMGTIRYRGEVIVCVPNRVIVSIRGGSEGESFDGITQ